MKARPFKNNEGIILEYNPLDLLLALRIVRQWHLRGAIDNQLIAKHY